MGSYYSVILVVSGLVSALILGFILWSQRGLARWAPGSESAKRGTEELQREFLETTGYRLAEMPDAPLEQQVAALGRQYSDPANWTAGFQVTYVKRVHGRLVYYESFYRSGGAAARWRVPLDSPPPARFQIIKGVKAKPAFPHRVEVGDPRWDKAYKIYGEDPEAVRQHLGSSGLADLLDACVAVDLRALPGEVVFSDPTNKNLNAAIGGFFGAAAAGGDPAKMQELTMSMCNQITDVVLLAASIGG